MPRAAIWLPGLAVALGAAAATAHGLYEVALAARVPVGIAWLYPLITDGLALVAYAATARLHGRPAGYAWTVVVLAAGLSGLAQAAYLAAGSTVDTSPPLRFGVGAWPAVAAAVVAHLLYLLAAEPDPGPGSQHDRPPAPPSDAVNATRTVQPAVHAALSSPPAVHPDPYKPVSVEPRTVRSAASASVPHAADARPVEHPAGSVEQLPNTGDERPPRDRARAAAVRHADRHGALPTVSELEALAGVSRGTAAAALKALRQQPPPLHLVPEHPDPETQT